MRILITAGPTREYIDDVRFISNASSGRMGCALAEATAAAGHSVTLLLGHGATAAVAAEFIDRITLVPFTSVDDLAASLRELFPACDALLMAAAVGDFRPEPRFAGKLPRAGGPIDIRLVPTRDVLAGVAATRRADQTVVAFAVEQGSIEQMEAKARNEMARKGAAIVVLNTPEAMAAEASRACVLSPTATMLPWADRPKHLLAAEIIRLLG